MEIHGVPPMTAVEPLITIANAARKTGLAEWTLRRLVRSGAIPSIRVAGRVRRVRLSDVLAAMQDQPARRLTVRPAPSAVNKSHRNRIHAQPQPVA